MRTGLPPAAAAAAGAGTIPVWLSIGLSVGVCIIEGFDFTRRWCCRVLLLFDVCVRLEKFLCGVGVMAGAIIRCDGWSYY